MSLVLVFSLGFCELILDAQEKNEVPSDVELSLAKKTVRDLYSRQFKSRKSEDRIRLARNLVTRGSLESSELPLKYAFLDEAREIAIKLGEVSIALNAILALDDAFDIRELEQRYLALGAIPTSRAKGEVAASMAHAYLMISREHYNNERLSDSRKAMTQALKFVKKSRIKSLAYSFAQKERELKSAGLAKVKIAAIVDEVKAGTASPEENLEVGSFFCFLQNDWDTGAPLLAMGSDPILKKLAETEREDPEDGDACMALAQSWKRLAQKQEGAVRRAYLRRCEYWYLKASEYLQHDSANKLNIEIDSLADQLTRTGLIEPEDFLVHCWIEPRWLRYPLTRLEYSESRGIWTVRETSGIHSRSKVLIRKPLVGDFKAHVEIKGGHRIGLTASSGLDRNISVELSDSWRTYQFSRKGSKLYFFVDGRAEEPKYHKTTSGMESFLAITLKSGQTCQIRELRLE